MYHSLKFVPWVLKNILYILHNYIRKHSIYIILYILIQYTQIRVYAEGAIRSPCLSPSATYTALKAEKKEVVL